MRTAFVSEEASKLGRYSQDQAPYFSRDQVLFHHDVP